MLLESKKMHQTNNMKSIKQRHPTDAFATDVVMNASPMSIKRKQFFSQNLFFLIFKQLQKTAWVIQDAITYNLHYGN